MKFVILTGMSGAGKSTALKMLEDMGYFCVDNLPIPLILKFAELVHRTDGEPQKVAVGIDIRSGQILNEMKQVLDKLKQNGLEFEILFLDANDEVLVKRYKETRRRHPLAANERVDQGISREREEVGFLRGQADYIIDTSRLLTRELKGELDKIFIKNKQYKNLFITLLSFGFKYGIPTDSDLVFDVRFLPNPYYVEGLRAKTGNNIEIREYVMKNEEAGVFLDKLDDLLTFLIPSYITEGKNQLIVSIGCTGGKHRSVTLAHELYLRLLQQEELGLKIEHRDIGKDALRGK
jgi:UPF0042 nucleotide-binding protein